MSDPFVVRDSSGVGGGLAGVDVEVWRAAAEKAGAELELSSVGRFWNNLADNVRKRQRLYRHLKKPLTKFKNVVFAFYVVLPHMPKGPEVWKGCSQNFIRGRVGFSCPVCVCVSYTA